METKTTKPAPDLSVIVPPLAQARSLTLHPFNDCRHQMWRAPDGASLKVHRPLNQCWVTVDAPHDSPAWPGLLELAAEIRHALSEASSS